MWTVSPEFLQALTQSHTIGYSCLLTTPGGSTVPLTLASGTVSAQSGQVIRRTASLMVQGGSTTYEQLSTPGAVIRLSHGVVFAGDQQEYVPLITGELSSAAMELGNGLIQVNVADFGQRLQAANFLTAQSPSASTDRVAAVQDAVTGAVSTTVTVTASDRATIGSSQTWPSSRTDMVTSLLTDAGAEGFFLPDGSYLIRDLPQTSDQPVWVFKTGGGGTVKSFARQRPLDKLYNTVIVTPAALDGSQTWTQVIAQITDVSNPRHPTYIGTRPYSWQSPTIMTVTEAQAVAAQLLNKVQGSTETLSLGAVSNPALECGDVIRAVNPTDDGNEIIQHLLDSFTIDVASGDMTLSTRAAAEDLT